MSKIKIKIGEIEIEGEIFETSLGKKIMEKLPFTSKASLWGKEVYFEIPVKEDIEKGQKEVEKGDIAYWPDGHCLCLFFGPTPISSGDKILPASEVEVVGKIKNGIEKLENVRSGEEIEVSGL